uniref:Uncharacterized protein n=1 Tax=Chromera velia CCMP2878 TaxID=1169474 RepID=A0A0G4G0C4_9ALVE|eukprot:Cvel_19614.t1-p1 / transcript=Cvel_19614.t1 / gene=Cvel_19614 / organism=Chromera_velia_CCMP2878 / gene_product=hypothetical protein / transcript_product=hypothetical protein / location=Cvel_scaffold1706:16716-17506(-) / protein_length=234 / sequence_SO=supercontig / SO=protein_coding / is_pseudo=false
MRRRALVCEMEKQAVAIQTLEEEIDRISERKKIEGRERAVNCILQAVEEVGLFRWLRSGTEGGVGKCYEGVFWGGQERSPVSVTNQFALLENCVKMFSFRSQISFQKTVFPLSHYVVETSDGNDHTIRPTTPCDEPVDPSDRLGEGGTDRLGGIMVYPMPVIAERREMDRETLQGGTERDSWMAFWKEVGPKTSGFVGDGNSKESGWGVEGRGGEAATWRREHRRGLSGRAGRE